MRKMFAQFYCFRIGASAFPLVCVVLPSSLLSWVVWQVPLLAIPVEFCKIELAPMRTVVPEPTLIPVTLNVRAVLSTFATAAFSERSPVVHVVTKEPLTAVKLFWPARMPVAQLPIRVLTIEHAVPTVERVKIPFVVHSRMLVS